MTLAPLSSVCFSASTVRAESNQACLVGSPRGSVGQQVAMALGPEEAFGRSKVPFFNNRTARLA